MTTKTAASWALLLIFSLGLVVNEATGEEPEFDRFYDEGTVAFNRGAYGEAQTWFERARDLKPSAPGPWRWLARVARIEGRWQDCVLLGQTAIKLRPSSEYAPKVRSDYETCRRALDRKPYLGEIPPNQGALFVTTDAEGATVMVDGIRKGVTPLEPFPLNPGLHEVRIEAPRFLSWTGEVEVIESIVVDLAAALALPQGPMDDVDPATPEQERPDASGLEAGWLVLVTNVTSAVVRVDGTSAVPRPDGSYEVASGLHTIEVTAEGYAPWRRQVQVARGQRRSIEVSLKLSAAKHRERILGWSFLSAAAAFGLSGLAFGLLESSAYDEARDLWALETSRPLYARPSPDLPEAEVHTRSELEDLRERSERYGLYSNLSFGVAAAALGVSIYFFIRERSASTDDPTSPSLSFTVLPDSDGITWLMTKAVAF